MNDITNLLFEPYANTEENLFLKLEENFEMTQELITQTLTTNQLPHHRRLTTMKSNVKDNENEEKLQINNAHQTPLQYIQILENNLYQVNPDNSFELNALKKSMENKKIILDLFIEKTDEIESIIHDFTENNLNVQNVFCVDNEKKFFYLYSSDSKEINKLCIKKSSLLEMFNTTLTGESINCMDAFNGLFACGSSKGSVVVFQHSKKGNIEFVDKVQNERKISIVSIKFFPSKKKSNKPKIIVSDIQGQIYLIKFKKKAERTYIIDPYYDQPYKTDGKVDDMKQRLTEKRQLELFKQTYHKTAPFYAIELFNCNVKNDYSKFFTSENLPIIFIGVSCKEIVFYHMKPKINLIQRFSKPKYIHSQAIPDLTIGIDTISKNSTKQKEEAVLFLVCWGNFIFIYKPIISEGICKEIILIAQYNHSLDIIKMGFLRKNYIYVFDKNYILSVISTKDFDYNDVQNNELNKELKGNLLVNELKLSENDYNLFTQKFVHEDETKISYRNSIIKYSKLNAFNKIEEGLLFIGRKKVSRWILTNLNNCVASVIATNNYEILYSFYMQIIKENNLLIYLLLANGTTKEKLKQTLENIMLKKILKKLYQYIDKIYADTQIKNEDNEFSIDAFYKMGILIEFCNEININESLFKELLAEIKKKNLLGLFIEIFTGYILSGKVRNNKSLNKSIILDIIKYYLQDNDRITLTKILTYLHYDILQSIEIRQQIQENELLNANIYIQMNSNLSTIKSLFLPIIYMFGLFMSKQSSEKYNQFMRKRTEDSYNEEIINSKQYYGHKIFWYCNYCLQGKLYPLHTKMKTHEHREIVIYIYLWLLSDMVFPELLQFDSVTYFELINQLYCTEKLYGIICNELQQEQYEYIENSIQLPFTLKEITPHKMLMFLIKKCLSMKNNFYIKMDLYSFLYKFYTSPNANHIKIDNQIFIEAIKYFLQYKKEECKQPKELDPFNCHNTKTNEEEMAVFFFNFIKKLPEKELKNITDIVSESKFLKLKLAIHTYNLDVKQMFEVQKEIYEQQPIENLGKIFEWINDTFINLNSKKNQNKIPNPLEEFKKVLLDNVIFLCSISIPEMLLIFEKYYDIKVSDVLDILNEVPALQFEFVKRMLNLYDNNTDEVEQHKNYKKSKIYFENQRTSDEETKLYCKLAELSCEFGETSNLLAILKKTPNIFSNELYTLLNKNKIFDCAIYVCGQLGGAEQSITIVEEAILHTYDKIVENLKSINYRETKHLFYLNKFKSYMTLGIDICLQRLNENLWLTLLAGLYNVYAKFKIFKNDHFRKDLEFEFTHLEHIISELLSEILRHMCSSTGVVRIFESMNGNFQDLGFKEFRKPVIDVLYVFQKSIVYLKKVLIILQNDVLMTSEDLFSSLSKGQRVGIGFKSKNGICSACNKHFSGISHNSDDNLIVFQCGHIYHRDCVALEQNKIVCYVCRTIEINEFPGTTPLLECNIKDKDDDNNNEKDNEEELEEIEKKTKEEKRKIYLKEAKSKIDLLKKMRKKTNDSYNVFNQMEKKTGACFNPK